MNLSIFMMSHLPFKFEINKISSGIIYLSNDYVKLIDRLQLLSYLPTSTYPVNFWYFSPEKCHLLYVYTNFYERYLNIYYGRNYWLVTIMHALNFLKYLPYVGLNMCFKRYECHS